MHSSRGTVVGSTAEERWEEGEEEEEGGWVEVYRLNKMGR